jgi:hypothetical protein
MRAKGRTHGRFVALSGFKKVKSPPESRFPLLIIDATGLPIFPLCEWYRRKKEHDPGRTPETYLELLQPYFGFLSLKGYAWNDPPDRVRAYLVEFLRTDVGCQVGPAPEDGYLVETTGSSLLSKSSLGVLLAALTSLYDVLGEAGYYPFENPMRSAQLASLKREHLRQMRNAGAPDHAGIRSETHQQTNQRYPTAFFRQRRGKVWTPEVVMEADVVQARMRQTLDFMIEHASFLRDRVILLLLRQTGARLSEVLEMTVGGYRRACHGGRALVKNKGSRGREEKTIYFTDAIEAQLLTYIRTERAAHDREGRKRLNQLRDEEPLFLTEDGHPYRRSAFYFHWKHLFESAQQRFRKPDQIAFSPHDIRHLRVTRAMVRIKQEAQGNKAIEAELTDGFWRLMGWRSPRTMETYLHTLNKREALLKIALAEESEPEYQRAGGGALEGQIQDQQYPKARRGFPARILSGECEEDFSWYEEE